MKLLSQKNTPVNFYGEFYNLATDFLRSIGINSYCEDRLTDVIKSRLAQFFTYVENYYNNKIKLRIITYPITYGKININAVYMYVSGETSIPPSNFGYQYFRWGGLHILMSN